MNDRIWLPVVRLVVKSQPFKEFFFPSNTAFNVESVRDFPKRRGRERKYPALRGRIKFQIYSVLSIYKKFPCINSSKLKT